LCTLDVLVDEIIRQQRWLSAFESRRNFFILRYEQFVAGNHSELETYLGTRLAVKPPELPTKHSHTARTRFFGNWKNWFVESDIELFKPLFDDYLLRHHYDRSWQLDEKPIINPEHGSQYVRTVIDRKRGLKGGRSFLSSVFNS